MTKLVLFAALATMSVRCAEASIVTYEVSLTTGFLGTANPYFLDFQFAAGDASEANPNTVSVTSETGQFAAFNLTAGIVPGGGENIVEFTPADPTKFTLTFTEYETPPTPDLLSIYICDGSSKCVATTDPTGFDTVVSFTESLDPSNPGIANLQAYDTSTADLNTSIATLTSNTNTPEPGTLELGLGAFGLVVAGAHRQRVSAFFRAARVSKSVQPRN
jgi:hypothetical protein